MSDRIGRQAELITAELITRGASITKRLKLLPHNAIGTSSSDRLHQNRDEWFGGATDDSGPDVVLSHERSLDERPDREPPYSCVAGSVCRLSSGRQV
jgi:hypothetical protein